MWHRIYRSLGINIIVAALVGVVVVSSVSLIRQAAQVSRDASGARARLAELTAKKQALEAQIREQTGEDSVRYQAHLRLNLKNPGEHAIVVLPEEKSSGTADELSLWRRILRWFQNYFVAK